MFDDIITNQTERDFYIKKEIRGEIMKNITKFLSLTLVIMLLVVFGCTNVLAANDTITIKSSKSLSKLITNYDEVMKVYKTTSKKTVYSMQYDKK